MLSLKPFMCTVVIAMACWLDASAYAQPEDVGGLRIEATGKRKGQVAIATRSDVRMSIESGPATSASKLKALGAAIQARMPVVRKCYSARVSERPDLVGKASYKVALPLGKGRRVLLLDTTLDDKHLKACVLRAMRGLRVAGIPRPASAIAKMEFGNSAAKGVSRMKQDRSEIDALAIKRNAQGQIVASAASTGGEVRFEIVGKQGASEPDVVAARASLRAKIGKLLDCRRRTAHRKGSAAGQIVLNVKGRNAKIGSHTLPPSAAPKCVLNTLRQAAREGKFSKSFEVTVNFND